MVMKKFGMLSALESNYNILNIGNFVSYEQNNKIYLAKVLNIKNSKYLITLSIIYFNNFKLTYYTNRIIIKIGYFNY